MTCPLVTVSCLRDLSLLELQAQSFDQYLADNSEVVIIVNEINDSKSQWYEYFYVNIEKYYKRHNLKIYNSSDFDFDWSVNFRNTEVTGWNRQQVLKLLYSEKTNSINYCVLDSQNFLVQPWDPKSIIVDNKSPYCLNKITWAWPAYKNYRIIISGAGNIDPEKKTMAFSTPAFFNAELIRNLIAVNNGSAGFANWFYMYSDFKSEFALYLAWLESTGDLDNYHYPMHTWCHPMLRDSNNFDNDVNYFIDSLAKHEKHPWASANHRAWASMTSEQYNRTLTRLSQFNLTPNMQRFRKTYIIP